MTILRNTKLLQLTAYVSGLFTLFMAVIMILGYLQLEIIKPLENTSLIDLKEQYDANPNNEDLKEQVRALDLMARRAFFASRWQIETGTYLLLIGAIIFILSQRLLVNAKKRLPQQPDDKFDLTGSRKKSRLYLLGSSVSVITLAFIISFLLRKDLPDPLRVNEEIISEGISQPVINRASRIEPAVIVAESEAEISKTERIIPADMAEPETGNENIVSTAIETEQISDSNYPFFRGEGSRGIASKGNYPTEWNGKENINIKWKIKLPMPGFSSPIIWEDKIFLTGSDYDDEQIFCIEKNTGSLVWAASGSGINGEPETPPQTTEDTGLAAPTAATNGKVVCAIFANGNLLCLDMEGNRIWAKNLGVPDNHYGHSSSLIIHNNTLLVQYDHYMDKSLIAIDVNTGGQLWRTPRKIALSWASPVIAEFNGISQVILSSEPSVISYNMDTGAELWSVKCMSGEVGPSVAVNSKYVFAVNDFAKLVAIIPGPNASILWEDNEYTPEVSSPVATEELVYVLTSWGAVACFDVETGEMVWDHEFDYGFYASPIIAGDLVYMLDQAGVMHIIDTGREFNLISESPLGERTNCTPAFSEGKIYLRSDEHLYCVE